MLCWETVIQTQITLTWGRSFHSWFHMGLDLPPSSSKDLMTLTKDLEQCLACGSYSVNTCQRSEHN